MWWRPVTAIRMAETDGNPATAGVADWTPFITTPPYPDWPSGLCNVVAATGTVLERLNGDGTVDIRITSPAAGGLQKHYLSKPAFFQEAVDARVWSGIHFRTADEASIAIGSQAANWTLDHYFRPTN
jgi:hypothetical protein